MPVTTVDAVHGGEARNLCSAAHSQRLYVTRRGSLIEKLLGRRFVAGNSGASGDASSQPDFWPGASIAYTMVYGSYAKGGCSNTA